MDSTAEMIFTGDELLRGDAINTNQAYLGERLLDLGIFATHALCVVDNPTAIVAAIRQSLARRPTVLILSGGLGPTEDDLTREAVAEALGRPLEYHENLLQNIRKRFALRGFRMAESNRKQAWLPRGARAIPISGTAPGFSIEEGDALVVALPGVPWELKEMWEGVVEPMLQARTDVGNGHAIRRIQTFGIGESAAAEMLSELEWRGGEVEIGTRARLEGLTIILRGPATPEGTRQLDAVQERVHAIFGDRVFGLNNQGLPEIVGELLRQARLTVAVAESCTGGLVAKRLTDTPGSSDYFVGGVTAYSNVVKSNVLGVPEDLLARHGAVSKEVAAAMAEGAGRLLETNCVLSTTGIAGPDGGSDEKPVGLVFVGSVVGGITQVDQLNLFGRRHQIRERAALAAIDILRLRILKEIPRERMIQAG